jgi:hypothetical protein
VSNVISSAGLVVSLSNYLNLFQHASNFRPCSPTCGRGKSKWVLAHWYEEGTFKGESRGIKPDGSKLDVEGQTRFLVNDNLKITEMVVTRTFSDGEKKLQETVSTSSADAGS